MVLEEAAAAQHGAEVGSHEEQQRGHNGEVKGAAGAETLENLDAFLDVDEGDVEAEDVAGEAGDPAQPIARVCDGEDPVQYERPSGSFD